MGIARRTAALERPGKQPGSLGQVGVPHRESSTRLEPPTLTITPVLSVVSNTE